MRKALLQDTSALDAAVVTAVFRAADLGRDLSEEAQAAMDRAREMRMRSGGDPLKFDVALEAGDLADTLREFVRSACKLRNVLRVQFPDCKAVIDSYDTEG